MCIRDRSRDAEYVGQAGISGNGSCQAVHFIDEPLRRGAGAGFLNITQGNEGDAVLLGVAVSPAVRKAADSDIIFKRTNPDLSLIHI